MAILWFMAFRENIFEFCGIAIGPSMAIHLGRLVMISLKKWMENIIENSIYNVLLYIIQDIFILRIYNILLRILWFSDYCWIPQKQSRYISITMCVSFAWNAAVLLINTADIYRDEKKLGYIPILALHSPKNVWFIIYLGKL